MWLGDSPAARGGMPDPTAAVHRRAEMGEQSVSVLSCALLLSPPLPFTACVRSLLLLLLWLFVLRKIQRCRGAGACLWLVAALSPVACTCVSLSSYIT